MANTAEQLAALRDEIAKEEKRLSDLQVRTIDMRVGVASFLAEYEQKVWPLQKALQEITEQLEQIRGYSDKPDIPGLPDDYVPVAEQYRRVWRSSVGDKIALTTDFKPRVGSEDEAWDEVRMKKLYRELALQFHPDFARDDATRQRWTEFMVRINHAFTARDAAALRGIAEALKDEAPPDAGLTTETALALVPDESEIDQAKSRLQAVQLAIQSVEGELFDVEWGWEMKLKKEADAAADKGRDLLAEMAADVQAQLEAARKELAWLQR